jgi:hypothetical protein
MSSAARQQIDQRSTDHANQRVLDHLFEEYERVRIEKEAVETRLNRFGETIQTVLASLSATARREYARRFEQVKTGQPPKGGDAFNNVIWLFQREPEKVWTAPEVKDALEDAGRPISNAKALSNAIAYLERSGRLKRVGWGQYMLVTSGIGVADVNGFDDGTVRNSEHFV